MGGNVYEWNEALITVVINDVSYGAGVAVRGAARGASALTACSPRSGASTSRRWRKPDMGFRVATIPEPSTVVLAILAGALGWAYESDSSDGFSCYWLPLPPGACLARATAALSKITAAIGVPFMHGSNGSSNRPPMPITEFNGIAPIQLAASCTATTRNPSVNSRPRTRGRALQGIRRMLRPGRITPVKEDARQTRVSLGTSGGSD